MYDKRVIIDFDDTLCIHPENDKSDILNGKPNLPLIEIINKAYHQNYRIEIYTARGHLSTKDRIEAELTYRKVITEWLKIHNVKWHFLSFEKPLGIVYIDDKAIRPNEIDLIKNTLNLE